MKKSSAWLGIKEKQSKITTRYYFTPINVVKNKKSDIIESWQG